MIALILRIAKQMHNDKRSLALILFAPILMISLLYLLLGESSYTPAIGIYQNTNNQIIKALKDQNIKTVFIEGDSDISRLLEKNTIDAVVEFGPTGIRIKMLEENSTKATKITEVIRNVAGTLNPTGSIDISFVYGKSDGTMFDSLGYILLGILSFFFVFIISGISFVRERTTGTMERLMLSPVRRIGVVAGYAIGFGIFAALQGIFIILFTKYILQMEYQGSVLLSITIMILLACTAILLGALVSIFANNEFQVMQFIPLVIIPQIFFSGLLPIATIPFGLGNLAYIMPVYYGCMALKGVIIRGNSFGDIWGYILALGLFIIALVFMNSVALKKYRKL